MWSPRDAAPGRRARRPRYSWRRRSWQTAKRAPWEAGQAGFASSLSRANRNSSRGFTRVHADLIRPDTPKRFFCFVCCRIRVHPRTPVAIMFSSVARAACAVGARHSCRGRPASSPVYLELTAKAAADLHGFTRISFARTPQKDFLVLCVAVSAYIRVHPWRWFFYFRARGIGRRRRDASNRSRNVSCGRLALRSSRLGPRSASLRARCGCRAVR